LKFIAPKTPQPIFDSLLPMLESREKGVYQLLVHLWLKSMEKEISPQQFPLFYFRVFAIILKIVKQFN